MSRYQQAVSQDRKVVDHLRARGLGRREADTYRLGVVADPAPGHFRFQGKLAIPYLDRDGQPLTIRFRCIEEHDHRAHGHGKYNSMADDPPRLYNVGAIFRADDEIHVTEGEMDAIVLERCGFPAVGIPGAAMAQPRHWRMLAGFSRVLVWGDPDDAGAKFSAKVREAMRTARVVPLSDGDVGETFLREGEEGIRALRKRALK